MTNWSTYTASFDRIARLMAVPLPRAIQLVHESVTNGLGDGAILFNEAFAISVEEVWNGRGRPSYRVAPALADALAETRLDVAGAFVRLPHDAFALELPLDFDLRNSAGRRLTGLLVGAAREVELAPHEAVGVRVEAPDGEGTWRLIILQSWEGDGEPVNLLLTLRPETTVESRVQAALASRGHDATITDGDTTRRVVGLALGAAMFAVSANTRFVRRIGNPNASKRAGRRATNRAPEPKRWSLGADIHLPHAGRRPHGQTSGEEGTGHSLQWAHVRQGHLRLTPCGPRDARRYELRYIGPTVVRPDLPLAPAATRHVLDQPDGRV